MIPKTVTNIGRLQIGDRFYFPAKKNEVQQLMDFENGKATYKKVVDNQPAEGWIFSKSTGENKEVIFLRHTISQSI